MNLEAAHPRDTGCATEFVVGAQSAPDPPAWAETRCWDRSSLCQHSLPILHVHAGNNNLKKKKKKVINYRVVFIERPHKTGKVSIFRTSRRNALLIEYCIPLEFMHEKDLST